MAGTDADETKTGQTGADDKTGNEAGTQENGETVEQLKASIAKLEKSVAKAHADAAKYRVEAKNKSEADLTIEQQIAKLNQELENTKRENVTVKRVAALEKAGCIEAELIANKIPEDETDINGWVEDYKKTHPSLFEEKKPQSHGGAYKPQKSNNLTPSQQMNAFIRSSAGRQ